MNLLKNELKLINNCPNYDEETKIPRIFIIGFNKCATATIHFFFLLNKIKSLHWYSGKLDKEIKNNIDLKNDNLLGNLDNFYVYSDCEELRKNYKLFEKKYPEAKFILNIRDVNKWILSRLNHCNGKYLNYWNKFHKEKNLNLNETIDFWKNEWNTHIKEVNEYFKKKKEKLLIVDIDKENVEKKIINFLDINFLEEKNIKVHKSKIKYYKFENNLFFKIS